MILNGKKIFFAHGVSQWPTIRFGDALTVEEAPPENLRRADIVVFRRRGRLFCHRIVAVKKNSRAHFFLTKGDAALYFDGWIAQSRVIGRVTHIRGRTQQSWRARLGGYLFTAHSRWQGLTFYVIFRTRLGRRLAGQNKNIFANLTAPWLHFRPAFPTDAAPGFAETPARE